LRGNEAAIRDALLGALFTHSISRHRATGLNDAYNQEILAICREILKGTSMHIEVYTDYGIGPDVWFAQLAIE
jgi:hypothetical protein